MTVRGQSFISLFSRAGGFDLGLEQAGWNCLYASDIDSVAVDTLNRNKGFKIRRGRKALEGAHIENCDIRTVSAEHVLSRAGVRKGEVSLLVGGPPCQSWSSAGHQLGFSDPRGKLFEDFVRIAAGLDVRWLLFENVRGLLTARGPDGKPGSALHEIRKALMKCGFQTAVGLLNAADFGLPQRRVRLFVVGFRAGDTPPFPMPTHAKNSDLSGERKPWTTLEAALAAVDVGESEVILPTAELAAQLALIPDGQGVKSPGKREHTRPGGHWGYKQGAFIADLTKSARTVTANAQQDWVRDPRPGLRRLCPRECAAIQGFPAHWEFTGNLSTQYRLIGNAVPPPLACAFGVVLSEHIDAFAKARPRRFQELLPLPCELDSAIRYTARDERSNGSSRRSAPSRRVSLLVPGIE